MPIYKAATNADRATSSGVSISTLFDTALTNSDYCAARKIAIPSGSSFKAKTGTTSIAWFMVLNGRGQANDQPIDATRCGLIFPGTTIDIFAVETLDIIWVDVPEADRFDPDIASYGSGLTLVDWSREPVLQSEHDTRTRVYMATPGLVGTSAVKAEMITYPPGASAPKHHHERAEHFQLVLSGHGTAVLGETRQALGPGDLLYIYSHDLHYFETDPDGDTDFVFVEFFIPGHCKTVWANDAKACAWLPTGKNSVGSAPARDIAHHVHGDDAGI